MNIDFTYHNPTRIHFGRTAMDHLEEELKLYGPNVLFVYGKNSIKKSGLYDTVMKALAACGKQVTELSGINSNPRYTQVLEGARDGGVYTLSCMRLEPSVTRKLLEDPKSYLFCLFF